jgi:hypothetical protein
MISVGSRIAEDSFSFLWQPDYQFDTLWLISLKKR